MQNLLLDLEEIQKCQFLGLIKVWMRINQDFECKGQKSAWTSLGKKSTFKEIWMLTKNWIRVLESWQKGPCLSGRNFSVCLLLILYILLPSFPLSSFSFLFLPPPPSHLWKKIASLQFEFAYYTDFHVTVPAASETNSPSPLPNFRFLVERIRLTQLGTHPTLTRGTGFKIQTWP